ncbi:hypothetical protein L1987_74356 [Smallanthus sonchifolius]|uniref:Uncharacterized protein n=1 Tax=Smallanthus sonchifolius TaxID=185202 RepID=A0ACB9A2T1_9ASTR|nr:hypothetical protein L1987_74356 [Smallanthus sonchifolius]
MASSSTNIDLMSLMHNDVYEFVSDHHLMESLTHVFPHNLPNYVVIDVDPLLTIFKSSSINCNVTDEIQSDYPNVFPDSQSGYIPHFSPPRSNSDYTTGDLH